MHVCKRFLLACLLPFLAATGHAQQNQEMLPNIKAKPAYDLAIVPDFMGGTKLIFSTLTHNRGTGAFEVIAGETGSAGQNVYQRI